MFGLTRKDFEIIEGILVKPLQKQNCQLFAFGSRARGDHREFSDLDVLVEAKDKLDEIRTSISSIRDQLEESELPIKVDIVLEADLAESYKASVTQDKISF